MTPSIKLLLACVSAAGIVGAQAGGLPATVKIGGLMPLTGDSAFIGEEFKQGIDLAIADHNAGAKAKGFPEIEMVYADSQGDARMGVQGYQRLVKRDGVKVVVLTWTNVANAIAPKANADHTAMVNISQGAVTLLGKNFSSTVPAYSSQGELVLKHAVDSGVKTIGVIYENSESFVTLAKQLKDDVCPRLGCRVVASEEIPPGSTEVAGQVTAVLSKSPDAIFPIAIAPQLTPVARELKTRGYKGKLLGITDMAGVVNSGNIALIEGATYAMFTVDKANPTYKRVGENYKKKYSRDATPYVYNGYKTGEIIASTVDQMKTANMPWSGPDFVKAELGNSHETFLGPVKFHPDGRIIEPMDLVRVEGGQVKIIAGPGAAKTP